MKKLCEHACFMSYVPLSDSSASPQMRVERKPAHQVIFEISSCEISSKFHMFARFMNTSGFFYLTASAGAALGGCPSSLRRLLLISLRSPAARPSIRLALRVNRDAFARHTHTYKHTLLLLHLLIPEVNPPPIHPRRHANAAVSAPSLVATKGHVTSRIASSA